MIHKGTVHIYIYINHVHNMYMKDHETMKPSKLINFDELCIRSTNIKHSNSALEYWKPKTWTSPLHFDSVVASYLKVVLHLDTLCNVSKLLGSHNSYSYPLNLIESSWNVILLLANACRHLRQDDQIVPTHLESFSGWMMRMTWFAMSQWVVAAHAWNHGPKRQADEIKMTCK